MRLTDIHVVLVRPRVSANVGAACRVIRNWGLGSLRLVMPGPLDEVKVRTVAYGSEEVWESRQEFGSMMDAVKDAHWVVGTTRRAGRFRKRGFDARSLAGAALERPDGERIALVFGSEESGLDQPEIEHCHSLAEIRMASEQPSINLSHAVALFGYELYQRSIAEIPVIPDRPDYRRPATHDERLILLDRLSRRFEATGYPSDRLERLQRALRHFFLRPWIEEPDIRVFHQWIEHWEGGIPGGDSDDHAPLHAAKDDKIKDD